MSQQHPVPVRHMDIEGQKSKNCRETYGNVMRKNKGKKVIRVVFQNINGLGTTVETDKRDTIREYIKDNKVTVVVDILPLLVLVLVLGLFRVL